MNEKGSVSEAVRSLFLLIVFVAFPAAFGQDKSDKKTEMPQGTPVLWRDPGDVTAKDFFHGPGGPDMKPDLSNVTFIEEEIGGYSPKFRVRDGAGKIWVAKLGKESQPETVTSRLVWAVGYVSEIPYLVPCVQIKGAPEPRKKVDRCNQKGFANVRFEARPENVKRLTEWSWTSNPFVGRRELNGLIVLMALVNNWDLKDSNNKILHVQNSQSGESELHYIISDLGATLGKTGNFISHNRNSPGDFAKSRFIERVAGQNLVLAYDGKNKGLMSKITVEDARWIGGLLSQITDKQLQDALRAANYSPEDSQVLLRSLRSKINELGNLKGTNQSAESKAQ